MPSQFTNIFNNKGKDSVYTSSLRDKIRNYFGFKTLFNNTVTGETRPTIETLPESFKTILSSLEDIDDTIEKLNIIHAFALDYMIYTNDDTSDLFNITEIINKKGKGDCDSYASLEMAILQYAGFDKEKIAFVAANVSYSDKTSGDHAFVLVEDKGDFYLLDMNFAQATKLDEETLSARGFSELKDFPQYVSEKSIEIKDIYYILTPEESIYYKYKASIDATQQQQNEGINNTIGTTESYTM